MKMAIDAGHGSNTAGKRTPDGYREHYANVKVAAYFAKAMDRCGISYIKTGWNDDNSKDDPDTSLSTRQKAIKDAKCDYSISFHFNASGDGKSYNSGEGIETLISDKDSCVGDSLMMANYIQQELIKGTKQKNRGVKRQALSMCNCKVMGTKASVMIECGFMTNKHEADLMQSDSFCLECAEEAAKGFCNYIGKKYVENGAAAPQEPSQPSASTSEFSYLVKITADLLNVRAGAGTSYKVNTTVKKNQVFTIVEEKNGWGKLKSGAGWISLKYTVKC